jgi:hypothetical protein
MQPSVYQYVSTQYKCLLNLCMVYFYLVTKNIQGDIPWCMLFADDVVLVDEIRVGVNRRLELWRHTL